MNKGKKYHDDTKYVREKMKSRFLDWSKKPKDFKQYLHPLKVIPLKKTKLGGPPIFDIMAKRRSIRDYSITPISYEELSTLIWSVSGITGKYGDHFFRTTPSAGGLYPVETYIMVNRVKELEKGLYHVDVKENQLEMIKKGSFGKLLSRAALDQELIERSAVSFIFTAIFERSIWKYEDRAFRYIYMDAGHIGQNLYLAATALGLGCCTIGAFFDDEVNDILSIEKEKEIAIYLAAIGKYR